MVAWAMWREEPFRAFFPLGIVLAWVGVGHWIAYWAGWIETYSCLAHGIVQIQGFLLAFALGFLLTAIPRRTASDPPSAWAMLGAAAALAVTVAAAFADHWWVAEGASVAIVTGMVAFAVRRFSGTTAGRRPPAAFVLIPMALVCNVVGAALLAWGAEAGAGWSASAGRLLIEQGLFLCLVMGAGALVLPLMAGEPPPPDLGSSPAIARHAAAYAGAGLVVVASLAAEAAGSEQVAPLVRAAVVASTLAIGAGVWRRPVRPGWNRRVAWLAVWLVPTGIALSGLLPDYRVPALHVTFIGGFALLALAVATHVTAAHLDLATLRDGRSGLVATVAVTSLLAMAARFIADATHTYFEHLVAAGAIWIAGTGCWMVALLPRWLGRRPR